MNHQRNAEIFKALCDENRLEILELLQSGRRCACDLAELANLKQSALSYHMKVLCESGIVKGIKNGKWIHYYICPEGSAYAMSILRQITTLSAQSNVEEQTCCQSPSV